MSLGSEYVVRLQRTTDILQFKLTRRFHFHGSLDLRSTRGLMRFARLGLIT